jgi:hypothetical protein
MVVCKFKPHPTLKGYCLNGKDCLYHHEKCALLFPPTPHTHVLANAAIAYSHVFDGTLGFPCEGLLTVASYNINGTRGSLAAVLAQAKQARLDILLLMELHFYENGEHLRVGATADRMGWTMVHSPATRSDPSSGVAIVVRNDSTSVVPLVASARSVIASRYITMQGLINGTQQTISSVYLSAQAPARKTQLHAIIKSKILK